MKFSGKVSSGPWAVEQMIKFWWRSGSQIQIWIHITTLVRPALAEVCTVPVLLVCNLLHLQRLHWISWQCRVLRFFDWQVVSLEWGPCKCVSVAGSFTTVNILHHFTLVIQHIVSWQAERVRRMLGYTKKDSRTTPLLMSADDLNDG